MTLQQRKDTVDAVLIGAVAVGLALTMLVGSSLLFIMIPVAMVLVPLRVVTRRLLLGGSLRRLGAARRTGARAEFVGLSDEIAIALRRDTRFGAAALVEADALVLEERWTEARQVLESGYFADAGLMESILRDNELAWVLAHDGEAPRAVTLAEQALAGAAIHRPAMVPAIEGTLGWALLRCGRAADAQAHLETAASADQDPATAAVSSYHLGEALRELGRLDEARDAYERAAALSPNGPYAKRAAERLAQSLSPYR